MKRYVIDLDGVCCDFTTPFKRLLDDAAGETKDILFDVWHWDQKYYPIEHTRVWKDIRGEHRHWWYNTLHALPGVDKVQTALYNHTLEPIFLTNRNFVDAECLSALWLGKHEIRHVPVLSVRNKATVASGLDINAVIDDSPENVVNYLRTLGAGPNSPRIYMVKYDYNRALWEEKNVRVVSGLEEFLEVEGV